MTPADLHAASGAMRAAASAMSTDAERYGDGARAAREPIGALQTVAAGPDVDRLARQGRRFVDHTDDVPGLLHAAADALRAFADDTERAAEAAGRLDTELVELQHERMTATSRSSLHVDASDTQRIEQQLRAVVRRRDELMEAWRASAGRVSREVGDVDGQLSGVVNALQRDALGRAAVTGLGVARGVAKAHDVLDSSGGALAALGVHHREARLSNANRALMDVRWTASPHRPRLPGIADWGLPPQAQRADDARRTRQAAAAIPRAEANVAAAQRAVDTNQPLTRASARASQLWDSPARRSASKFLGPAGHVFSVADISSHLHEGEHMQAGLAAVGLLASAAATMFPATGAVIVVGVAVAQHHEEIAAAGRWVRGKVKGWFGR